MYSESCSREWSYYSAIMNWKFYRTPHHHRQVGWCWWAPTPRLQQLVVGFAYSGYHGATTICCRSVGRLCIVFDHTPHFRGGAGCMNVLRKGKFSHLITSWNGVIVIDLDMDSLNRPARRCETVSKCDYCCGYLQHCRFLSPRGQMHCS